MADLVAETAPTTSAISGIGTQATAQPSDDRRGQPAPHRQRSRAGPALRYRADPGQLRYHHPLPTAPRQRPAGELRDLPHGPQTGWHPATRAYIQRRPAEGQTKKESSAASNEPSPGRIYTALRTDLAPKDSKQPEPKINKPLPDDA
jgi:hypothetical protein